jgi:hypothetical protein
MLAAEVYAKGKKVDIPARTLRRAFKKLGGVPDRKGFPGLVTWELKTTENTDKRNNSKFRFVDGRLEPISRRNTKVPYARIMRSRVCAREASSVLRRDIRSRYTGES